MDSENNLHRDYSETCVNSFHSKRQSDTTHMERRDTHASKDTLIQNTSYNWVEISKVQNFPWGECGDICARSKKHQSYNPRLGAMNREQKNCTVWIPWKLLVDVIFLSLITLMEALMDSILVLIFYINRHWGQISDCSTLLQLKVEHTRQRSTECTLHNLLGLRSWHWCLSL